MQDRLLLKTNKCKTKSYITANNSNSKSWAIILADKTISPREYYNDWILIQYCLDIKKMNYQQILADTTPEESVSAQMMNWYNKTITQEPLSEENRNEK
ncbi:hypothetical protein BH11BAC6_BH11BAC6_15170 [soil metagenome]